MKLDTQIDEVGRSVSLCLRCNVCTYGEWPENYPLCPFYAHNRTFASSPGGLMYLVRALLENRTKYTSDLFDSAYSCTNCRACDDICEIIPIPVPHVKPTEIIRLLRHELVKRDLFSNEFVRKLYETIKKNGDVGRQRISITIPENMKNEDSQNILFVEGIYSEEQKQIYNSALEILQKIGLDVYIYQDGGSSGADLYDLGFIDELRILLEQKSELINKIGEKRLIFIDPHTQEFILGNWHQYLRTGRKIIGKHLNQLILDIIKESRLKTKNTSEVTVSYHDPCVLGRGLGIYDAPRELIKSFEGVTLREMKRNRRNSYCCGAGDGTRGKALPEYSERIASERCEEFKETGADILITSCPYCKEMFQKVLTTKEKAKVKDLIEFVNERIE